MSFSEKKRKEIIELYSREMEEIKLRIDIMKTASSRLKYDAPTVDFMAIELRKVIEHIVFASLISNSDIYLQEYNKLGAVWNIHYICNEIKRINPNYFPVAVIDDHTNINIIKNEKDSISEDDIISMYNHLGKLLHSHNPFSQAIDYKKEREFIVDACNRIIRFLSVHTIHLWGDEDFLYVIMECKNKENHVAINWFQKIEE